MEIEIEKIKSKSDVKPNPRQTYASGSAQYILSIEPFGARRYPSSFDLLILSYVPPYLPLYVKFLNPEIHGMA